MADTNYPHNTTTHTARREVYERETRGNSGMAFIVGILVVVVAFLLWMFFGATDVSRVETTAPSDVNITVTDPAPVDNTSATVAAPAPEAAPVDAAPADAAPADVAPADAAPAAGN